MKLLVAYAVSITVSLLGLVAVMSPHLAANGAPLSGITGLTLAVVVISSFWIFWRITRNLSSSIHVRLFHGLEAFERRRTNRVA